MTNAKITVCVFILALRPSLEFSSGCQKVYDTHGHAGCIYQPFGACDVGLSRVQALQTKVPWQRSMKVATKRVSQKTLV